MNAYFKEIKKNFGFGCMRFPMIDGQVDFEETKNMIDAFLESYQSNMFLYRADKESNMAMSMAKQKCNMFKPMTEMCEIRDFLRQLFDCQLSNVSPGGKKIIHQIGEAEMEKWFD